MVQKCTDAAAGTMDRILHLPLPFLSLSSPLYHAPTLLHLSRFLVKTVRHSEMRLLLSLIPLYYRHVQANPGTLLTRFYGVHRVKPSHGRKVRPGWLLCHSAHACLVCTFGRSAHFRTCI